MPVANSLAQLPKLSMAQFFRAATVLFILCLFTVGSLPAAGHAFPGTMHIVAHLSAYALIAFSFGMGWQNIHAIIIAVAIASIGFIHELTEIITHNHEFEIGDVFINSLGAVIGTLLLIVVRMIRKNAA